MKEKYLLVLNRRIAFRFIAAVMFVVAATRISAGEGMWIPLLLENKTIADMQADGLKLSASDIYSINQACLKDAVVMFGRGCTGELISSEGLILTNHHCGYSRIQANSTLENNHLENGFWASAREQELPNRGLTVSFLVRIEDVTARVLEGIAPDMKESERQQAVEEKSAEVIAEAMNNNHYEAAVESFWFGRDYYLFVYEVFKDVRLVGTPPEAIGKFGGDTDNWIWPRHTGDFSLFRVYAGKDNKPAPYSKDNIPYKPKKYFTISTRGLQEGDFTMVMGYPARTDEYLYSAGLAMINNDILPAKIRMREARLSIMSDEMSKSPAVKLQYSNKYQGTANAWKKWLGVTQGMQRTNAISRRQDYERQLLGRLDNGEEDENEKVSVFKELAAYYGDNRESLVALDLGAEVMNSIEMFRFASRFVSTALSSKNTEKSGFDSIKTVLKNQSDGYFRTIDHTIESRCMSAVLGIYKDNTKERFYPPVFTVIQSRHKGSIAGYVNHLYEKSLFADQGLMNQWIEKFSPKSIRKLIKDPLYLFYRDFSGVFEALYPLADSLDLEEQRLYRRYLDLIMTLDTTRQYYPDANFTMRVAWGKAEGYRAADAVTYQYFSTHRGILEKESPEIPDYQVPEKLKMLLEAGDFEPYGVDSGLPVCFIASNHTSGGNSGSPVLNAEGKLVGINFDRNWEGTISDYVYDPAVCRNITLDIRYILFIIDKYAGAHNLLKELTID
jgi:hypothetical protein